MKVLWERKVKDFKFVIYDIRKPEIVLDTVTIREHNVSMAKRALFRRYFESKYRRIKHINIYNKILKERK